MAYRGDKLFAAEDRRDGDTHFQDAFGYFKKTDVSDVTCAEVTVLDQTHGPCSLRFDVSRAAGLYTVSVHLLAADAEK